MARRILFGICVCGLLYIGAAAVALLRSPVHGHLAAVLVEFSAPAIAAMALLMLSLSFPSLLEPYRFAFPVNLTAPAVFCALTYCIVSLVTTPQSSIEATPEVVVPALAWLDWRLVAATYASQVVLLSATVLLARRLRPPEVVPPPVVVDVHAGASEPEPRC